MAEVFGMVAGVAGILEFGSHVSTKLRLLRRTWTNAGDDLITLQNDLADLEVVFRTTEEVWKRLHHESRRDDLTSSLQRSARKANAILQSLEDFVDGMADKTEAQKKRAWVRRKTTVDAKRAELGELRAKMREVLRLCETDVITRTQFEVCQFRSAMDVQLQVLLEQQNTILSRLPTYKAIGENESSLGSGDPTSKSDAMMATGPLEMIRDAHIPEENLKFPPTVSIFGLYRNMDSHCEDGCTCWCHFAAEQRLQWSTPRMLRGIVGMWLASYHASATWSKRCNTATCKRQASSSYQVQYEFPIWLTTWTVQALIQRRVAELPTFLLKFRPRVRLHGSLHWVCFYRPQADIRGYIEQDPESVSTRRYSDGMSPFLAACQRLSDNLPLRLDILVRAGGSLDDEDDFGISAAQRIAEFCVDGSYGRELRKRLAELFPLSRMIDDLDLSSITKIVLGIHAGDVRSFLSELPRWKLGIDRLDCAGRSSLHWAARQGDCYAIEQLILHSADPNIETLERKTPLMELAASWTASEDEKLQGARLLVEAGANIRKRDISRFTAFYYACKSPNTAGLISLLFDHEKIDPYEGFHDGYPSFSKVVDPGVIKSLKTKDMDINFRAERGRSALMFAVRIPNPITCRILLEHGADPSLVDEDGKTILHYVAQSAGAATMSFLADFGLTGVDPDALDGSPDPRTAEAYFWDREWTTWIERVAFVSLLQSIRATYDSRKVEGDQEAEGEDDGDDWEDEEENIEDDGKEDVASNARSAR